MTVRQAKNLPTFFFIPTVLVFNNNIFNTGSLSCVLYLFPRKNYQELFCWSSPFPATSAPLWPLRPLQPYTLQHLWLSLTLPHPSSLPHSPTHLFIPTLPNVPVQPHTLSYTSVHLSTPGPLLPPTVSNTSAHSHNPAHPYTSTSFFAHTHSHTPARPLKHVILPTARG